MTTAMASTALRSCPSTGTLMLGRSSTAWVFTLIGILLPLLRLHTTQLSGGASTRNTTIPTTRSFTSVSSGSTMLSTSCSYSCARPSRYRRAISVCRSRAISARLRRPLSARTSRYGDAARAVQRGRGRADLPGARRRGRWLCRSVLTPVIGESRIQLLISGRCFVSGSWIRLLGACPSSEPRLWLSSVACQGRSATGSACGRSTLTRSSGRRIRHLRGRARCGCQPVESELADTGSP